MHDWGGDWGFGFGHFGFGIVFWIVLVGLVLLLVLGLARSGRGGSGGDDKSALDILKQRYARGEIDKDEFERKKKDLGY